MQTVREWILDRMKYKRKYGLERMRAVMSLLGNPQDDYPIIHVTGTNGKGSTIAMLSSLFVHHGQKVGAFVSPHLIDYTDRFLINGNVMSEEDFEIVGDLVRQAEVKLIDEYEPLSFFEIMTAMALVYFSRKKVEVALLEVGIGGLLDITNIVHSTMSVITSIGFDHEEMLGNTLEEIAIQKTGIFKQNQEVVLGNLPTEALKVAEVVGQAYNCDIHQLEREFNIEPYEEGLIFKRLNFQIQIPRLNLKGKYQLENAAVALESFLLFKKKFQLPIDSSAIQESFKTVTWPGRMEVVHQSPTVILDGAHNIHALKRLVETVKQHGEDGSQQTILFSALKRKHYKEMVDYLRKELLEARLVITTFEYVGAIEKTDYPNNEIEFVEDAHPFIEEYVTRASGKETLWITGSLYFISFVRKIFVK
ncbi:bifunctional folylpolyglutamate synthase/dihydrofolate synthase [Granulicatella elegans]|uniref:bifunctional folylpolyglutamate synthase/dihydrofolate synthase n=1 Tax=Granulicatella elegans TaxID=137732 RepID=UPI001D1329CD|nr:folylpolyglutamate synthase/dihydrofolate synthase family protein [Granulicatella elegans]UEA30775.1 bifunctional folylpolyglutamate synthase/dihydrofolate synthase [Granulicatella elegans]